MKFMLIMNTPRDGYAQYMKWPKKILDANCAFMQTFTTRLKEAGELVGTAGLTSPEQAKLVRAGEDDRPITDGVFAESKEFLAGYWLIDVESAERAYQIAADASKAPGAPVTGADGSVIEHFWIEVREVMGSHEDIT
jgi:hypothetical protein